MSESAIKFPEYIQYDANGRMVKMICKCCGVPIGEDRDGTFYRFDNYAEMKMRFADRSMHVTNACAECIKLATRNQQMRIDMHHADIDDMIIEVPSMAMFYSRLAPRVVAVDFKRRGIV